MSRIIREILLCSVDLGWSRELAEELSKHSKINCTMASTRSEAGKLVAERDYSMILFDETFKLKNINFVIRSLGVLKEVKTQFITFLLYDPLVLKEVENLDPKFEVLAYTLPLHKEEISKILINRAVPPEKSKNFDLEFAEILINSTKKVLNEMFGESRITIGKPNKTNDTSEYPIDIRGKIMIKSEYFKGSFFISLPKETYLALRNKVTGEQGTEINDETKDFAGEIANMIYGHSKAILHQNGIKLDMAMPFSDTSGAIKSKKNIIIIPISTDLGDMYLKLAPGVF